MESAVAGTSTLNVADAISIGVRHFGQQWIPWATSMGVVLLIPITFIIPIIPVFDALAVQDFFDVPTRVGMIFDQVLPWLILLLVCACAVVVLVFWLNSMRNAYRQCRGETITFGSFFTLRGLLIPFFTLLSVFLIVQVGLMMCTIPGLIAMVLAAAGFANGGPPRWDAGVVYLAAQAVWLAVDLFAHRGRIAQKTKQEV